MTNDPAHLGQKQMLALNLYRDYLFGKVDRDDARDAMISMGIPDLPPKLLEGVNDIADLFLERVKQNDAKRLDALPELAAASARSSKSMKFTGSRLGDGSFVGVASFDGGQPFKAKLK